MKRITLYLLLSTYIVCCSFGNRTMDYVLSFSADDFALSTVGGDTCVIRSSKYSLYSNYDPSQPELPVIYVQLLLPADATAASMSYTKTDTDFASDVTLINGSPVRHIGEPAPDRSTLGWYASETYASGVTFKGNRLEAGYRMAAFKVMPFTYDAQTGRLKLSSFTLHLQLNDAAVEERNGSKRGADERAYVNRQIWNHDDLNAYYPVSSPKKAVVPANNNITEIPKDCYIITNNDLERRLLFTINILGDSGN